AVPTVEPVEQPRESRRDAVDDDAGARPPERLLADGAIDRRRLFALASGRGHSEAETLERPIARRRREQAGGHRVEALDAAHHAAAVGSAVVEAEVVGQDALRQPSLRVHAE